MNNTQAKRAIQKATGTEIKLNTWKCDDHYEGHAEAYANCEKVKYHTGYTKWTGDIVHTGECWYSKTKSKANRESLTSLALHFGLEDIARKLQATAEKIQAAELKAYCGVTDLN